MTQVERLLELLTNIFVFWGRRGGRVPRLAIGLEFLGGVLHRNHVLFPVRFQFLDFAIWRFPARAVERPPDADPSRPPYTRIGQSQLL